MTRWPRPAIWLSALGVAAFQVIGTIGATSNQPERKDIDVLAIVLALAGPAALAVRDRWPVAAVAVSMGAAALSYGLGYAFGPIFVSAIVAIIYAVLQGYRRATWVVSALGYGALAAGMALDTRPDEVSLTVKLSLVAGWLLVVLAVAEVVRSRRDAFRERARAEDEERQRLVGEQRLELAQEMHDVLAHHISLINVQAGVALHLIDEQPERARPALAEIKSASREALRELRGALDILRRGIEAPRAPAPRLDELDRLVATVAASGLDVTLDDADRPAELPAAVELAAFRIVQEALTNVARHSGAGSARVTLRYGDELTVEVVDDGVGGVPIAGNGITGMRERATALGGTLAAGPAPGGGFRVVARLPVTEPATAS
jgi:signal transduction histidine kinase